jgi:O-antigen/teichoic acid export membrane protein
MSHIFKIFIIFGIYSPALFAYIDPGSGSAIMSAIIGFFVAIGLAIKTYWYKFKSFFVRKKED